MAMALGVAVSSLFVDSRPVMTDATYHNGRRIVVRSGERKRLRVPRSKVDYELLTPDLSRAVEFLWIEYQPGSRSHPESLSHPGEENAVCIEGSVVVAIEGQEFVLDGGDSISFDSGLAHQVENRSKHRAIIISAITPPSF
jgi:quercetin dioxygenase-like cupin family protein